MLVQEHYFEMSRPDAERALSIYRAFAKQTEQVVQYLSVARHYEHATRLEIPKIKHAPTGLANSLEEYLNDKDFEVNRRQYLAQQEARKRGKSSNGTKKPFDTVKPTSSKTSTANNFPSPKPSQAAPAKPEPKGPALDLIDFFDSIEQNQQPMAQPQYEQSLQYPAQAGLSAQPTGFLPQTPACKRSPSTRSVSNSSSSRFRRTLPALVLVVILPSRSNHLFHSSRGCQASRGTRSLHFHNSPNSSSASHPMGRCRCSRSLPIHFASRSFLAPLEHLPAPLAVSL